MKQIVNVLLLSILLLTSSCGTIMYPERRGQAAGKIDPKVAILNGVGTLLFFIPGVIAFAVDFNNGAIYLPTKGKKVKKIKKKFSEFDAELNKKSIEFLVLNEAEVNKNLDLRTMQVRKVDNINGITLFNY